MDFKKALVLFHNTRAFYRFILYTFYYILLVCPGLLEGKRYILGELERHSYF